MSWLRQKINNDSFYWGSFLESWFIPCWSDTEKSRCFSLVDKEILQASQQEVTNRLRTQLCPVDASIWWASSAGLSCCGLCSLISSLPRYSSTPSTRDKPWRRRRNLSTPLSSSFYPSFKKELCWVFDTARKMRITLLSQRKRKTGTHTDTHTHRRSERFCACCTSDAWFLFLLCLKEFSQFAEMRGTRRRETNWHREREAEEDWMCSPPRFTSLRHPEAFSEKKQAAVRWIKQARQPLPGLPSKRPALIFQSLSAPVLWLFYSLPGKLNYSFGPPLPPPPSSLDPLIYLPQCPTICSRLPFPEIDFRWGGWGMHLPL